jgi:Zn-finger nucleic acid-binding protein
LHCPRCDLPLYDTTVGPGMSARGMQCSQCEGHWLSPSVLREVSSHVDVRWYEKRKHLDAKLQVAPIRCPACGIPTVMRKVPSPQDKKVIMDVCPTCHGVWLDGGELTALQEKGAFAAVADLVRFLFKG